MEDRISFCIGFSVATALGIKREYDLDLGFGLRFQLELGLFALTGGLGALILRRALTPPPS